MVCNKKLSPKGIQDPQFIISMRPWLHCIVLASAIGRFSIKTGLLSCKLIASHPHKLIPCRKHNRLTVLVFVYQTKFPFQWIKKYSFMYTAVKTADEGWDIKNWNIYTTAKKPYIINLQFVQNTSSSIVKGLKHD